MRIHGPEGRPWKTQKELLLETVGQPWAHCRFPAGGLSRAPVVSQAQHCTTHSCISEHWLFTFALLHALHIPSVLASLVEYASVGPLRQMLLVTHPHPFLLHSIPVPQPDLQLQCPCFFDIEYLLPPCPLLHDCRVQPLTMIIRAGG